MSFPVSVKFPDATTAAAISDALLRVLIGLDTNDRKLYESAWITGGNPDQLFEMGGKSTNINDLFNFIGPVDTQHLISNVRVNVEDGNTDEASVTAYAWAQHHRPGEGVQPDSKHLTSGSRYFVDVVRDSADGLWKIKKWVMTVVWLDGDRSIVGQ
jgi:hypothetical protein